MRTLPGKRERRQVSVSAESLVRYSTLSESNSLPLIIHPASENTELKSWIAANLSLINSKILEYGGVLFRGFPVESNNDFHEILEILKIPLMNYVEGATPRTKITDRIYTSTEFPKEYKIELHNELSYVLSWPMKISFFAYTPVMSGGETIIADIRRITRRIPKDILDEFEQRKWKLIRNYNPNLSLSWQRSFGLETKSEVEDYCRKANLDFKWKGDVLQTTAVRPAIHYHPVTKDRLWFNHIVFWHPSTLIQNVRNRFAENFEREDFPYHTTYGDGEEISDEIIQLIHQIHLEETVAEPWQKGDLLLLDNMLVAHGRNPFEGDRAIYTAMGENYVP